MTISSTVVLPMVVTYCVANASEVPPQSDVLRWQTEWMPRFPWPLFWSAVKREEVWNPSCSDCPADLKPKGGYTLWPSGLIRLNASQDVRACLAHELGHCAQHFYKVLPAGHPETDAAGTMMWGLWRALPDLDDEETFASVFRDYLLGTNSRAFFRHFAPVVDHWRTNGHTEGDPYYDGAAFYWWDGSENRQKRYDGKFWYLTGDGAWIEVTP